MVDANKEEKIDLLPTIPPYVTLLGDSGCVCNFVPSVRLHPYPVVSSSEKT